MHLLVPVARGAEDGEWVGPSIMRQGILAADFEEGKSDIRIHFIFLANLLTGFHMSKVEIR